MDMQAYIRIDDIQITGWENISIRRSMDALAGAFSVSVVDNENKTAPYLIPGAPCEITLGEGFMQIPVLSGYIDKKTRNRNKNTTKIDISGRDKTADLVDCAAIYDNNTWTSATLKRIVSDLCSRYNISVVDWTEDNGEEFKNFTLQADESAFNAIERACNIRGVLPITNQYGELLLTHAATDDRARTELIDVPGQGNIINIQETTNYKNRFSEITVKGQNSGGGSSWGSDTVTQIRASATDSKVNRYRPLIIISNNKVTKTTAQQQANWEIQVRRGRSTGYSVTVRGWEQVPGVLWDINQLAYLKSIPWDVDEEYLITDVEFTLDNNSRTTTLQLKDPIIYRKDPANNV